MSEERLVPKLRFNGFDEEWIKTNLGNISSNEMYGMNSAAKEYDGFNKYIRITDISETSNKFVPNPLTSPDGELEAKYQLQEGDLVFARTGASTGKTYLYDKNDGNLYFAGFLIKFHIDKAVPKFIFYNTLKEEYLNWVSVMSVRSGQPGINSTEYQKFPLYLPSLDEQNKISNFLSKIDEKIELLENKHQYYQDFKKYLMQQIFAQKLRFADCTDEWKVCKFKDLGTVKSGVGFSNKYQGHLDLDYNVYKVSDMNLKGNEKVMSKSNNTIDDNILNDMGAKLIREPSIIFAKVGEAIFLNRKRIAKPHFLIDNNMMAFSPNNNVDLEFMYYLTTSINFGKYAQTGALPSYNASDIYSIKCKIPPLEEQKRIGNLLSLADNKINNCSNQINNVLNFKRGLLQQMFV